MDEENVELYLFEVQKDYPGSSPRVMDRVIALDLASAVTVALTNDPEAWVIKAERVGQVPIKMSTAARNILCEG